MIDLLFLIAVIASRRDNVSGGVATDGERSAVLPWAAARASRAMESTADPALRAFLTATETAESERLLSDLLDGRARRTIRDVVRRVLGAHFPSGLPSATEDVEDVCSEAVARVLRALRDLKIRPDREPIQDFDAYAARIAKHTCYEHFRRRHPERARLRNQVWYLLSRDPAFRIEPRGDGRWTCRLAGGEAPAAPRSTAASDTRSLRDVVLAELAGQAGGLELNDLVNLVAPAMGVRDGRPGAGGGGAVAEPESLPDPSVRSPVAALEDAELLRRLWTEVRQLPLRQRTALLLNLRDAGGGDALDLLPLTGTASIRDIAAAVEIDAVELAALWPALPLDDNQIAGRLGVTRQQVINLRKAARARLGRRLAAPGAAESGAGNTAASSDSRINDRSNA
jgi:RNA polymerase sigma factor (sigma-70 family)